MQHLASWICRPSDGRGRLPEPWGQGGDRSQYVRVYARIHIILKLILRARTLAAGRRARNLLINDPSLLVLDAREAVGWMH